MNLPDAKVSREQAERLLVREARLLDERRYDEWLALYADDAAYWVPARRDARHFVENTPGELSLLRLDRGMLADWVTRMSSGAAHVELPSMGATRMVAGVEADESVPDLFHCAWMIQTHRQGSSELYSGRSRVELLLAADGLPRIRRKTVHLIQDSIAGGYLPLV